MRSEELFSKFEESPSHFEGTLSQDFRHHVPVHIGQSEFTTVQAERQPLVVHSQQVQDRCVQIVYMHLVSNGVKPELIRLAQNRSTLDARTRHPHRKGFLVVIASDSRFLPHSVVGLRHWRSSKLGTPDDKRLIE